jgi:hypothetical protein
MGAGSRFHLRTIVAHFHFRPNHASTEALPSVGHPTAATMGQATPFKPIALVVEDDEMQRELVATLLEESEMG